MGKQRALQLVWSFVFVKEKMLNAHPTRIALQTFSE